jgi:hypothetical protein
VIRAVITIIKITRMDLSWVIFTIIIHLGINPKNGGRPPSDNRAVKIASFVMGSILLLNTWLR